MKKWMMLEIFYKNAFEIMTVSSNLVFFCRFWDHNLNYCSFYITCEICVLGLNMVR